ncbi:hypothetical protein TNCV_3168581 [Trichonephila clavipes]|nr:hypothetical protein TNCV_3168581 [Trichonephila clavipes]
MNPDSSADDHRTRVWRRTGQRSDPAFIVERHTAISQGVTKQFLGTHDHLLVVLQGTLTARRVDDILTPIVCYQRCHLSKDNFHIARSQNVFKDMTSYHGLPGHQIFRQ